MTSTPTIRSVPQAPPRRPGQRFHEYLLEAARAGDPVVSLDPGGQRFLVHHPEAVKHVLQDRHENYVRRTPRRPLMGHRSLTLALGDAWRRRRRLMQPFFQPQSLAEAVGHAAEATEALVERWSAIENGRTVDLAEEMVELSLEVLAATLFGRAAAAGGAPNRQIHDAFAYFDARTRRGGRTWPRWIPTPGNRRIQSALATVRKFVAENIAAARGRQEGDGGLLSKLILAEDPRDGSRMSDEELVDEMMMLLVMGHRTTAMALAWTWYRLALDAEADRRLAEELAAELAGRPPSADDLERLSFTRRVVEEVLRLYPPTWSITRRAVAADVIAGIAVPADATIQMSPYVTHRQEDLWPEPERFDPDRFLPKRSAGRHRFAYFPFGGGPRACIANHLVMKEVPLVVARLAQAFRPELAVEPPVPVRAVLTLEPQGGLPMKLRRRSPRGSRSSMPSPTLSASIANVLERRTSSCLLRRAEGGTRPIAPGELGHDVRRLAGALTGELKLAPGDRVALVAENGPEWTAVDLAALAAGVVLAPIYPTLLAKELASRWSASGARVVFADPARCAEVRGLPGVERVVGLGTDLAALLERTADPGAAAFAEEALRRRPEDPATLVASPGTTGEPRQTLFTHGQLTAAVDAVAEVLPVGEGDVAYLPRSLASPFERILHYMYLRRGATVAYPESESTADRDLAELRPHVASLGFAELKRLMNGIYDSVRRSPPLRRRLFHWSVGVGRAGLARRLSGERPPGLGGFVAERWVFEKLRRPTGGRLKLVLATGTPLSRGWITFLWGAGLPIYEGYGLAETEPIVSLNAPGRVKLETAGRPLPGVDVEIADDGEVLLRSSGTGGGWHETGDLGRLDEEGFLAVTGRKAERVEARGKEISPLLVERLLGGSHFVRHAVIRVSDARAPVALLVPDFERLETVVRVHGIEAASREELVLQPRIRRIFEREIKSFESMLGEHERPRAFELLAGELTVAGGELTPDGRVRRHAVLERHADVFERLESSG